MEGIEGAMALDDVDLFGDPVMDNALAGLPARPPPSKPLLQRLDELRTRGCSQAIAWSRQGTIAVIAKDGMSIDLRFIRCRPDNGDWELSEPSPWSAVSQSPSPPPPNHHSTPLSLASAGAPFVHLAWGPQAFPELAIIDALGRVTILSFSVTLNRPYPIVRRWDADVVDDLHAVVGCYWLPLVLQHTKQAIYEHQFYPASGPWHPSPSKSALLCVTTNGTLKLFFLQSNGRLEETAIELESVTSSDDLITHASLCSDKNTLLLALATASRQLRVVRVSLQWGLPQVDKQVPPGSVPLRPSLREGHVAVTTWVQHGPSESPLDASMTQLSHIEILPSASEAQSQPLAPPVVLTVRSYVPQDSSAYHQESQSIIDRWEVLSDQPQSLHPAFEQLSSKDGAGFAPPTKTRLRKLDPIILPKIVVTVHTAQFGRILCFAFSDGTVQFRDRFTMEELYREQNTDTISSPLQVGFQFINDTPCLQVAFSPTNCSFAQLCEDWTVKWNKLHYPTADPSSPLPRTQLRPLAVALSVAASVTGAYQVSNDDVLAVARPFAQMPNFTDAWIRETVSILKVVVDYSEDAHHDQLVRNAYLQACFSMLSHLGFQGDFKPRPFSARFAMLALNLRNMVVLITVASNTPVSIKEKLNPLDDPEVVEALAGWVKWGVDLLSWLVDCLFALLNDSEVMAMLTDPKRFLELARYLRSKKDVSLHLLLCSSTRGFLSAACRRLVHLESISSRTAQFYETNPQLQDPSATATPARPHPALIQAYLKVRRVVSSSVVKMQEFDRLLSGLGKDIQSAYQKTLSGLAAAVKPPQGNLTEEQQQQYHDAFIKKAQTQCELDMLLGENPPPAFRDMLLRFFTTTLPEFRRHTDPAKLFFANYDVLEVEDNARALSARKAAGKYIDVFKRVELVVAGSARGANGQVVDDGGGAGQDGQNMLPAKRNAGGEEVNGHNSSSNNNNAGFVNGSGNGNANGGGGGGDDENGGGGRLWRRCVRCAAVMEDIWSNRPGFNFVLAQQRRCACGGSWVVVPRGS
ncbi:uncharacterized protein THITE_2143523 [Thermothielavioides terrestris NRRL 8126]|uniref:Mediator of RNA polymerase II transcription subunit 16 n=1 Tax=Thermothielavioides terrestris (strain ATCC 38088 / NRRL 8126) TaxID=578455 RepID=G2R2U7_THETT|nr:uncharacterized protein THITE_2143523 [Thermothielavioides terrestris NRRL 8126]AEO65863.1 hypothetical protein THITE_2143523 [Thermothielavioides terrestris NRRL 8126]